MSVVVSTWILAMARLAALLWVQALWRTAVPGWTFVALGASGLLALLVDPISDGAPHNPSALVMLVVLEVLLGLVIGMLAALPGYALLGATTVCSAVFRVPRGSLVTLGAALALALALGLGLHHPLVHALLETFAIAPLGEPMTWLRAPATLGISAFVQVAHAMLVLALALATPVLLVAAVLDLAVRLLGRGPGPIPLAVAPLERWLRAAAGMLALGASWAAYGHAWADAVRILPR